VDGVEVAVEVWTRACGCQRDHEKWNRTMRLKYLSKENGEKPLSISHNPISDQIKIWQEPQTLP